MNRMSTSVLTEAITYVSLLLHGKEALGSSSLSLVLMYKFIHTLISKYFVLNSSHLKLHSHKIFLRPPPQKTSRKIFSGLGVGIRYSIGEIQEEEVGFSNATLPKRVIKKYDWTKNNETIFLHTIVDDYMSYISVMR